MVDVYLDEIIKVDRLDPDGKKYDKVSRIEARSEEHDMEMKVDLNTEIYPVHVGEKFRMALAPTLNLDGTAVTSHISEGASKSLADKFEYVMHGLLYKMSEDVSGSNVKVVVYISFGGLQLMLKGDPSHLGKFRLDQRLFLLLRKAFTVNNEDQVRQVEYFAAEVRTSGTRFSKDMMAPSLIRESRIA